MNIDVFLFSLILYIFLTQEGVKLPMVSEADMRAALTAHIAMPLTGHAVAPNMPYYPTLPGEVDTKMLFQYTFVTLLSCFHIIKKKF